TSPPLADILPAFADVLPAFANVLPALANVLPALANTFRDLDDALLTLGDGLSDFGNASCTLVDTAPTFANAFDDLASAFDDLANTFAHLDDASHLLPDGSLALANFTTTFANVTNTFHDLAASALAPHTYTRSPAVRSYPPPSSPTRRRRPSPASAAVQRSTFAGLIIFDMLTARTPSTRHHLGVVAVAVAAVVFGRSGKKKCKTDARGGLGSRGGAERSAAALEAPSMAEKIANRRQMRRGPRRSPSLTAATPNVVVVGVGVAGTAALRAAAAASSWPLSKTKNSDLDAKCAETTHRRIQVLLARPPCPAIAPPHRIPLQKARRRRLYLLPSLLVALTVDIYAPSTDFDAHFPQGRPRTSPKQWIFVRRARTHRRPPSEGKRLVLESPSPSHAALLLCTRSAPSFALAPPLHSHAPRPFNRSFAPLFKPPPRLPPPPPFSSPPTSTRRARLT
ncbi:hypothetical protein K525DRAFT_274695, partial [Schizophyllum commune Loenen D]